jgi:hypothetical protein
MDRSRALAFLALAAMTLPLHADDGAAAGQVVTSLYKTHFAGKQRFDLTLKRERGRFAAPLLKLLDEDSAAQAATPGEVVGLDYDPLTSSQEEAESYRVGSPRLEKGEALVPVEIQVGKTRSTLTIHLVSLDGHFRVSNIQDQNGDLVSTLKKLKAEREHGRDVRGGHGLTPA